MIYTLYLSSAQGVLDSGVTNSTQQVSWNINWDDCFKKTNKMFTRCRVKHHLLSVEVEDGVSSNQSYTNNNRQFYLSANFQNDTQSGNRSGQNTTTIENGTLLGLVKPIPVDTPDTTFGSTARSVQLGLSSYTLNTNGISILCPQGFQKFTILLNPVVSGTYIYTRNWNIILQFFFDEDE